jgi:hypothetical protein
MTDFRALCQELMDAIDSGIPVERIKQSPLAVRVDAALAQPEPQGPTAVELWELYDEMGGVPEDSAWCLNYARAALARWGHPVIEPVPVSERLPGPEDCDAEGCCWAIGKRGDWMCVHAIGRSWSNPIYTHWLPHWALPVPKQEGEQ